MSGQKQLPSGPVVQAITVQDGDMRVTISAAEIEIARIGPQGGVTRPTIKMKGDEVERFVRLLELAQNQQRSFSEAIRGR